jgi:hypothetical protein
MEDRTILAEARALDPVSDHGVNWYPASWQRAIERRELNETLGGLLRKMPGFDTQGQSRITRAQVVECFARSSAEGYFAAIIWGCGTGARNRARMLKVFSDPQNEVVLERIDRLVDELKLADPGTAWNVITRTHRLKWLGVAFGTKIAYFAALSGPNRMRRPLPLIADAMVRKALCLPVTTSVDAYVEYCRHAARLAEQLEGDFSRPDQIEYALFKLGGKL